MEFEPIKIKVKNIRQFTEIAYIIDRPSFINEAKKIRKKYKIIKPMKNNDSQQWWLENIPKENISLLFKEITELRMFFGYDSNYGDIFEKAVLGGDIEDNDYQATILFNFAKIPSFIKYDKSLLFGIILTLQTDKKDVIKAFNQYKKIEKKLQSSPDSYAFTDERIDKRLEIKRDRKWYWKSRNKLTYWQIAQADGISRDYFEDFYKDRIAKAIKSYKQKLGIL